MFSKDPKSIKKGMVSRTNHIELFVVSFTPHLEYLAPAGDASVAERDLQHSADGGGGEPVERLERRVVQCKESIGSEDDI